MAMAECLVPYRLRACKAIMVGPSWGRFDGRALLSGWAVRRPVLGFERGSTSGAPQPLQLDTGPGGDVRYLGASCGLILVRSSVAPLHPVWIIEQRLRVFQTGAPEELHDIVVAMGNAEDAALTDGDPPSAGRRRWVHDYGSSAHVSRMLLVSRGRRARLPGGRSGRRRRRRLSRPGPLHQHAHREIRRHAGGQGPAEALRVDDPAAASQRPVQASGNVSDIHSRRARLTG